jgi:hypothetical protein
MEFRRVIDSDMLEEEARTLNDLRNSGPGEACSDKQLPMSTKVWHKTAALNHAAMQVVSHLVSEVINSSFETWFLQIKKVELA